MKNNGKKLLIVEKEISKKSLINDFFKDNYLTISVGNGEDCLKKLKHFQPDVILLDLMLSLSGLNGFSVLKKIRKNPIYNDIKIIVMMDEVDSDNIVQAWDEGANAYIVKNPFNMYEIQEIVEKQLQSNKKTDKDKERENLLMQLRQAQKMEAIGTLAGGIAHDLNNIIFPILGYAEISLFESEIPDDIRDNIEEIHKSAKRAQSLVRQILAFSRQTIQEKQIVDVKSILEEVLKLIKSTFPVNIKINTKIQENCITNILADPVHVHQIFMNLCTNAKQAMEEKGGLLNIFLSNIDKDEKKVRLKKNCKYLKIEIEDTGCGISPENQRCIFDPFFTTKAIGKGTGMGLSVVYGIVKNLKGEIIMKSKLGKGSTFQIYFPVSEENIGKPSFQEIKDFQGKNQKIIVVDDEDAVATLLKNFLGKKGYDVVTFNSCQKGIEYFEKNGADLLITDLSMPKMKGIDLAKEFWKIQKDFPVILITGFSDIEHDEFLQKGIRKIFAKPIDLRDFCKAIHDIFEN